MLLLSYLTAALRSSLRSRQRSVEPAFHLFSSCRVKLTAELSLGRSSEYPHLASSLDGEQDLDILGRASLKEGPSILGRAPQLAAGAFNSPSTSTTF